MAYSTSFLEQRAREAYVLEGWGLEGIDAIGVGLFVEIGNDR